MPEQRLVIEAHIFVATPEGADPEEIASIMDRGLDSQLQGFPAGEITGTDVAVIRPATEEEQKLYFVE